MTATPSRFALASRRVVLPDGVRPAAVLIDGERIAGIVAPSSVPSSFPLQDLANLVLAPGLVDAHVHINEPGRTEWEGFETATRAAAAGGITTLVDMPLNSSPVTTTRAALEAKRAAASGKCWVDVGFYGGLIPGNSDNIESLLDAGVLGIKAFLCDSGLPEFPPAGIEDLKAAMPLLAERNRPLLVHAELCEVSAPAPRDVRSYSEYLASRPPEWEAAAIRELIALCRGSGCPVHVVHLANADALPMLQAARQEGLPISVETCPHYLHFEAENSSCRRHALQVCAADPRSRHRELLWDGLQRGVIDTIGSDHSPCPPEMKRLDTGDFSRAWGGIASLQLTLPIVWTGAAERGVSLNQLSVWLSEAPARLLRLDRRKGRLAAGYDADLVVWDPDARWTVRGEQLQHRHKLTPYDGAELAGRVHRSYLRGSLVYDKGAFPDRPSGALLSGVD